jgi:ketosteroid isomerase-like protein
MQRGILNWIATVGLCATVAVVTVSAQPKPDNTRLQDELRATETAFAKTMADRDRAAFATFIADEAVFFGRKELRGKAAIVEAWKGLYEGKDAPFSWKSETVSVLDSGTLGLSSGPVFGPDGKQTGTFSTIWRRKADGKWEIVFDKGCPYCPTQ